MDFVYVKDVAKANIAALLSDVSDEVFNVGCSRETSLKELLDLLLKVNKADLQPEFREESSINPVSRRLANIDKAKEELGWEPKLSFEDGVAKTVKSLWEMRDDGKS